MENVNDLAPCPFCGGKGKLIVLTRNYGMDGAFIRCEHCKAQGPVGHTWETHLKDSGGLYTPTTPQSIEAGKRNAVRRWNGYTALATTQ